MRNVRAVGPFGALRLGPLSRIKKHFLTLTSFLLVMWRKFRFPSVYMVAELKCRSGKLTMQPVDDSASPLSGFLPPLLSRRHRDPPPFSGEQGEYIHDSIRHYERVRSYNPWDDPTKLANVVLLLESTASTWFDNHQSGLPTSANFSEKCCHHSAQEKNVQRWLVTNSRPEHR